MPFYIIRAKIFRTRKNFPGSNASLLPGFLGLWIPVSRSAEPLDGIGCNSANICNCCRRIIFLLCPTLVKWTVLPERVTVVSYVGGRTFRVKILNCIFLVPLAPLGLERSRNDDFMTPEAQKVEKMLVHIGSYGHFT